MVDRDTLLLGTTLRDKKAGPAPDALTASTELDLLEEAWGVTEELVVLRLLEAQDPARLRLSVWLAQIGRWEKAKALPVVLQRGLVQAVMKLAETKPFGPQMPVELQARLVGCGVWERINHSRSRITFTVVREHLVLLEEVVAGDFLAPPEHPTVQNAHAMLAQVYCAAQLSPSAVREIAGQGQCLSNAQDRAQVSREVLGNLLQTIQQQAAGVRELLAADSRIQALRHFVESGDGRG